MSDIKIRFAEIKDTPQLADMLCKFHDYFNAQLGDNLDPLPDRETLESDIMRLHFSDNPMLQTLIAQSADGRAVGRLSFYRGWASSWYLRFHLSGIFVPDEFRGQGIADKLFERLIEIAKEEKAKKIVWNLWRPNKKARKFYERMGGEYLAKGSPSEGDANDDLVMQYRVRK
ncbi:MAG: GNAT family N-acetyltransferase [Alphaproteobacteria bacterium]|nr:GNAT family N-acetyltransferase [Alphaproteobacteria bacterium]